MTEFQELVKDAPKFVSMKRGELVAYAYAMYASGAKMDAENTKLRELVLCLLTCHSDDSSACDKCPVNGGHGIWEFEDFCDSLIDRVHELGVEVKS